MTNTLQTVVSLKAYILAIPFYSLITNVLWYHQTTTLREVMSKYQKAQSQISTNILTFMCTTGATSGTGIASPSGAPEFTPGF